MLEGLALESHGHDIALTVSHMVLKVRWQKERERETGRETYYGGV